DIVNLRDDPSRHAEVAARVRADFDAVLVHGDPRLIPFEASFQATDLIAYRLQYTGYVTSASASPPDRPSADGAGHGEVLVSGGGGPAGYALMEVALAARRAGYLAEAPWRLLTGANLPAERFEALVRQAPAGVQIDRFRSDFPTLLRLCRVSVSQAG